MNWREKAECLTVDPESMFPDPSNLEGVLRARAVCERCTVKRDCDAVAEANDEEYGVWGGRLREKRPKLQPTEAVS